MTLGLSRQTAGKLPREVEGFILSREVMGCTPATIRHYRARLDKFFRFAGSLAVRDIERSDIDRYLIHLRRLDRSPHYVDGCFRALRAFFNWCVEEEFIGRSPMRTMKPSRLPKRGKPFLTEAERDLMLAYCDIRTYTGARMAAQIWLFWTTGIRLAENANLLRSDLDWERSRIRVFGKGQKERYVPFTKHAKAAVWRYLAHRDDELPELWLTEERRPATAWAIISAMRRLLAACGLKGQVKDLHHIFRRTWAWRNIKAGQPVEFVRLVGGWESVQVLEGYIRAMKSEEALGAKWV